MLPVNRQPHESLENWEARLIAESPARERAQQRDIVMNMPEHEYRRRKAELNAPIKREPMVLPDARTITDAEYAEVKAKLGIFPASLMR